MAFGMIGISERGFVGVPSWATTERFDILAKVDPADLPKFQHLSREQQQVMVQRLLEDRFGLKTHFETREQSVFELVVVKPGPQFKEAKAGDDYANGITGNGGMRGAGALKVDGHSIIGQAIPISTIAMILTQDVGRTVVDKTGLSGKYDVALRWAPDQLNANAANLDTTDPSLFTAIQEQLGLKLLPAKAPAQVLVIDHLEKPTGN
jgi:uncharacterized protein (TIGR03435 family)